MFGEINKVINTRFGKMIVNKNDELIGKSLEIYGEWAQAEMDFITPYIPFGGICVDVGAYIGTHTLFLADAVGPRGIVIAFEPQQPMFQLLCANAAINQYLNIRAFNYAIDERSGLAQLDEVNYAEPYNFASVSVNLLCGYPIEARSLDDCSCPTVDLIKIDVAGYEENVIKGCRATIQKHEPLIYCNKSSEDLVQLIRSFDYDVYEHQTEGYNPNSFKKSVSDFLKNYSKSNLFCVPKSKGLIVDLPRL